MPPLSSKLIIARLDKINQFQEREMNMKKYEFTGTNELTKKAFQVYSDSSFTFWKDSDNFYYSDNPNSEKVELGTLEDVNEFLEQFAD